jgi:serine/threonine protein kinase
MQELGLKWPPKEYDLLRCINHFHIVQLYDIIPGPGAVHMVLEMVPGGELLSYCLENGPLPEDKARAFFRDLVSAVDYLHRKGIVHRDIKVRRLLLPARSCC